MYVTKNLKFHHDNARLHVHKNVKKCQEVTVINRSTNSPEFALCDFRLNSYPLSD